MPHNPLVTRKLKLLKSRLGKRGKCWYIAKSHSNIVFYLADFDEDNNTAMWSRRREDGMSFVTEQGVLQYVSTYLNSRSDIHLIQTT